MKTTLTKGLIGGATLAAALFASASANAGVALKVGGTYSGATTSPASVDGSGSGIGYEAGLGFTSGAGPIGLMVDVLYASRKVVASTNFDETFNSLYVPVQAMFRVNPVFYLSLGAYGSYGLGSVAFSGSATGGGSAPYGSFADGNSGITKVDYGIVGGLGFMLHKISLEARYNFGLKNIWADSSDGVSIKSKSIDVLVGYHF